MFFIGKHNKIKLKSVILGLKKYCFILVLLFILAHNGFAQRVKKSYEIGLSLGGSYYIGDLNPLGQFNQFTKPAGGLVFRTNFNPRLSSKVTLLYGRIEGRDSFSKFSAQQQRNLRFKSDILELSGQLEFNFLDYEIGNDKRYFSPYIFLGLAGFKFNPKGELDGKWVALQPLGTEGQGLRGGASNRKYKLLQMSIPFGVGIKANLSKDIGLSLEWGMRKTFTDYLDDVSTRYYDPVKLAGAHGMEAAKLSDPSVGTDPNFSNVGRQRGNPTTNDWYAFAGAILTIKLKEGREKCPGVD